MATTTFTPSMLRGAGTRGIPEIPAGSSFSNTYSLAFDGTDDIATGSLSDSTIHGSKTLSFWIKVSDMSQNQMVGQFQGSATGDYFNIRIKSNKLDIGARGAAIHGKTTGVIDLSDWTHILAIKNRTFSQGSVQRIYVNGVEISPVNATVNSGIANTTIIGKVGNIGYYGSEFEGEIDEIAILDTELSGSVSTIYNGGVPGDLTDLNPLLWYRCGDIVNASGSNVPNQGSNTEGDLVLFNDTSFSTSVPT
jgi:hypothetical protein